MMRYTFKLTTPHTPQPPPPIFCSMPLLTDGDPAAFSTEPPMAGDTGTDAGAMADFHYLCQKERPPLSNLNNCPEPSLCDPTLLKNHCAGFQIWYHCKLVNYPVEAHSHQVGELFKNKQTKIHLKS